MVVAAHPVAATVMLVQAHEVLSQQTPGQTAAHVPPQVNTLLPVHAVGRTTVHAPVVKSQHLPVQGFAAQVLVGPL